MITIIRGNLHLVLLVIFFFSTSLSFGQDWQTVVGMEGGGQETEGEREDRSKSSPAKDEEELLLKGVQKGSEFFFLKTKEGLKTVEAAQQTITYLFQLPGIKHAVLSDSEDTIEITDQRGFTGVIIVKPMARSVSSESGDNGSGSPANLSFESIVELSFSQNQSKQMRALILEPFEAEDSTGGDLKDSSPEEIAEVMKSGGIEVTHVKGGAAGIGQLAEIGEYDIVYMYTHCGHKNGNVTWMSGERVTAEKSKMYREKYGSGVVIGRTAPPYGKIGEFFGYTGIETYTVNADFIRRIKRLKGTVVYVSGCNSNRGKDNNSMAKALKEQGADIYVGYDGFMLGGFATRNTDVDFFKYLILHGLSVEEALLKKPSGWYGKSYPLNSKNVGRFRANGSNVQAKVDLNKELRIDLLKAEHRKLQAKLQELNNKIQRNPRSAKVKEWEQEMTSIRQRQKEIYKRVQELRG